MSKVFIFNHDLCVNCGACSAACILENEWSIKPRNVYSFNAEALSELPLINLSLACNHCETAICLDGCPAMSYKRDEGSGAVIINQDKCIGCKYCQWNCPYDAPKFDTEMRVIGKCHLCYTGLNDGRLPACAIACPTGALSYGAIDNTVTKTSVPWFPDKKLNPGIVFTSTYNEIPPRIIPERSIENVIVQSPDNNKSVINEWSLLVFTYMTTLSVSYLISSFIKGVFPGKSIFTIIVVLAGLVSLCHLGRVSRAMRAVINVRKSPLSREIAVFILYLVISSISVALEIPVLVLLSSLTGIMLLIIIDSVYIYTDRRKYFSLHSGQTFLSGLLIIAFFTGFVFPFLFIASIKLVLSIKQFNNDKMTVAHFGMRFFRISVLLLVSASVISGISFPGQFISVIFLAGEFTDRLIFYIDFAPVNIRTEILKRTNIL